MGRNEEGWLTAPVFALKVLCPGKLFSLGQTWMAGYPSGGTRPKNGQWGRDFGLSLWR